MQMVGKSVAGKCHFFCTVSWEIEERRVMMRHKGGSFALIYVEMYRKSYQGLYRLVPKFNQDMSDCPFFEWSVAPPGPGNIVTVLS